MRAVFPLDEDEFSFMKAELEVVRNYSSGDVFQTFRDTRCNMDVGGWRKDSNSWVSSA